MTDDERFTRICVEVPDKIGRDKIDELFFRVCQATDVWAENIDDRDWDPFIYGTSNLLWDEL